MSKKEMILVAFVGVLASLYVWFFTDWFKPKIIRIEHTVRSLRQAWTGAGEKLDLTDRPAQSVTFSFHKDYKLTSIKVVPLAAYLTNKYSHPLWQLGSKQGSVPMNGASYGTPIRGMTSAVPNAVAEPLEPGVEYLLVVEARAAKGTNAFNIPARSASRR